MCAGNECVSLGDAALHPLLARLQAHDAQPVQQVGKVALPETTVQYKDGSLVKGEQLQTDSQDGRCNFNDLASDCTAFLCRLLSD